jgi:hypothetical protein
VTLTLWRVWQEAVMKRSRYGWSGVIAVLLLGGGPASSRADIEPGTEVNKQNASQVEELVSPGVLWCLDHGMRMRIVPYRRIEWDRAYKDATEKYAPQVKLSADGRAVDGYVAGLPFPEIDPNDPQVALKIMWNYDHKPYFSDDSDLRNFDADTGNIGDGGLDVERHYLLDHLRTLMYVGRLYVDPKPEILPNPDGVRAKSSLHPILEPFDMKGVGLTGIRYLNPDRQDDTWLYVPTLRRVRRLSNSQRTDSLFGQDTDIDSIGGYAGQIPWLDWKYLGEKTVLGSFHSEQFPVKYCDRGGEFVFCDAWEKRPVYVIEGTPKQAQYAYGKRVLYVDKETYLITYTDLYDRAGHLWKVWINQFGFRKRAGVGYGIEYPDEMPFNHSIAMVDTQLSHGTRWALPSATYPGEEGWYFNQGAKTGLTEEFFTIGHLLSASH